MQQICYHNPSLQDIAGVLEARNSIAVGSSGHAISFHAIVGCHRTPKSTLIYAPGSAELPQLMQNSCSPVSSSDNEQSMSLVPVRKTGICTPGLICCNLEEMAIGMGGTWHHAAAVTVGSMGTS